jgi:tripartite-type tricarboxylate transporter receptor subunit TctC
MNVFETPMVLVTKASLPVKNLDELLAHVRKHPGKLSYGSPGIGSMPHLLAETLKIAGKLDMAHVPYKGFSPMVQALTTDELDMAFISVGTVRPFLLNGKLKLIAIDEGKVTPDLPQVPALNEVLPGFRTTSTYGGLFAPAGTPAPIVKQINAAAVKALASPGVNARVAEGGQIVIGDSPEHFAETVRSNVATLKELVAAARAAGAKFE